MSIQASGVDNYGRQWWYNYNGVTSILTTSAVSVAGGVATATVPSTAGWFVGQIVYTAGLTTNVAQASPVAITADTPTTVEFALTAPDGALADGVGNIGRLDWLLVTDERRELLEIFDVSGAAPVLETRGKYRFKDPDPATVLLPWLNQIMYGITGIAPA